MILVEIEIKKNKPYTKRNQFLDQPDSILKNSKIQFLLQHKSITTPGAKRTALIVAMQFSINQSGKIKDDIC